jgi:FkbM family methyltransferase
MKALLNLPVTICRNTPKFRGKWRLEAWLEKNRGRYAEFGPVTYEVSGHRYRVYPRTNFHLFMYGPKKNLGLVPLIAKYAAPGTTAIDVGAHSGYFTLCLSAAVGHSGKVLAFEASPVIFKELLENIDLNRLANVEPRDNAVSDRTESIDFYLAPTWKSEISSMRSGEGAKTAIDAVALDAFLPQTSRVSFVKIDVEGAEMKVLEGMRGLIERDKPVMVIEISDPWLKELGSSSAAVFDFLHERGYRVFDIAAENGEEVVVPPAKQIDALCLPAGA